MATYDPIIHFYDDPGHPYWPNNTASIKAEIMAIATEHGYTGAGPKTIAGAIDALADTLAGEDVSSPRSIAGAIHALAPYIGSGGGTERVELFNETVTTVAGQYGNAAQLAYTGDIGGNTLTVTFDGVEYVLPKSNDNYGASYGMDGFDFSNYPLCIGLDPDTNSWTMITEDAGEHTIIAYQTTVALGSMQSIGLHGGNIGSVYVATTPFDISGDNEGEVVMVLEKDKDIASFYINNYDGPTASVPGGSYIVVNVISPSSAPISGLSLTVDNEPVTDGYEVKEFSGVFYLTTRVPQGPAQHTLMIIATPAPKS